MAFVHPFLRFLDDQYPGKPEREQYEIGAALVAAKGHDIAPVTLRHVCKGYQPATLRLALVLVEIMGVDPASVGGKAMAVDLTSYKGRPDDTAPAGGEPTPEAA